MLRLSGRRRRPGCGVRSRLVKIGRNDPLPVRIGREGEALLRRRRCAAVAERVG